MQRTGVQQLLSKSEEKQQKALRAARRATLDRLTREINHATEIAATHGRWSAIEIPIRNVDFESLTLSWSTQFNIGDQVLRVVRKKANGAQGGGLSSDIKYYKPWLARNAPNKVHFTYYLTFKTATWWDKLFD